MKPSLKTFIIKSGDQSFNYLIHEEDGGLLDIYLCSMQGSRAAYKAEVGRNVSEG